MTAIARVLDKKLRQWPPATARKIERLLAEVIALADAGTADGKPQRKASPSKKNDPLFADRAVWHGKVPKDSSLHHDKYLYGEGE